MLRSIALLISSICLPGPLHARDFLIEITGEDACPAQFTVASDLRLDFDEEDIVVWDRYGSFSIPLVTVDRINYIPLPEDTPAEPPTGKPEIIREEPPADADTTAGVAGISDIPRVRLERNAVWLEGEGAHPYALHTLGGELRGTGRLTSTEPIDLTAIAAGNYLLVIDGLPTLKLHIK